MILMNITLRSRSALKLCAQKAKSRLYFYSTSCTDKKTYQSSKQLPLAWHFVITRWQEGCYLVITYISGIFEYQRKIGALGLDDNGSTPFYVGNSYLYHRTEIKSL